ncbi:hypothetical protein [Streptomyces koyangensis]|uniref:hypothetical protein n=1 Tax=Streptomyces koyangensis TaxID=188770 RepID=UPI001CECD476
MAAADALGGERGGTGLEPGAAGRGAGRAAAGGGPSAGYCSVAPVSPGLARPCAADPADDEGRR